MAEPERSLRRLVEEGTRAARQPPVGDLRRRARRRRTVRQAATATAAALAVAATVVAVLPLIGSEPSGTGPPAPTTPGAPRPSVARSLTATPTQTVRGGAITLHGTGCAPGKSVSVGIRWERGAKLSLSMEEQKGQSTPRTTATSAETHTLTSVDARADGSFEAKVTLPTSPAIAEPTLWARCRTPTPAHQLTQDISIVVSGD
ncbi:hypothetical protein [Streptomyces pseudovenezuelae]|uniref:Ig-like domain-containing protein n=1 Tax=Streptomyces pseudovenezuelae TaxID=67350 RepID=A0ABT6LVS6_9ACTN|nr:hypothetical protein [Streptomyces pseudovenezuelae]MDH6220318.1 hypothetical protein [Streptomyces pseudovenezuelae]